MFRFKKSYFFLIIIVLFLIYNCVFIYKRSFLVDGERYFVLYDDMMVSMRYAKNLAHGYGLVWNPGGERVEGYTNLLWVLYMSLFHLLPIPPSKISLFIQLSGVILLAINLYIVKKIVETIFDKSNKSFFTSLTAVFLTAFYYPLNNWAVLGTEVSILTLIVSVIVLFVLRSVKIHRLSNVLYYLLGLITLVRIDMAPLSLMTLFYLLYVDKKNRVKHLATGLVVILFFLSIQTLFRVIYYHDILPNTYYLKMVGYPTFLRITRGIYVFLIFIWRMNPLLFLFLFIPILSRHMRFRLAFLYIIFTTQLIYSIYVGGDALEIYGGSNRFIAIVMPILFILFSIFLSRVKENLVSVSKHSVLTNNILLVSIFVSLLNFNNIKIDVNSISVWLLLKEPVYKAEVNVKIAKIIEKITNNKTRIAIIWAGTTPYFVERYYIDLLGKNDKFVGREKMRILSTDKLIRYISFLPGHMKWNYQYSLGQLKPDIVILINENLYKEYYQEANFYLSKLYLKVKYGNHGIYILKGTKNVSYDYFIQNFYHQV